RRLADPVLVPLPRVLQGRTIVREGFFMEKPFYRPCWADVDLDALRHNFKELQRRLSSKARILSVVKANGYGHRIIPAALVAVKRGAAFLGVSRLEEGVALREAGFKTPVLVLGTLYPFDNFPVLFEKKLVPTVASVEAADALNKLAERRHRRLP